MSNNPEKQQVSAQMRSVAAMVAAMRLDYAELGSLRDDVESLRESITELEEEGVGLRDELELEEVEADREPTCTRLNEIPGELQDLREELESKQAELAELEAIADGCTHEDEAEQRIHEDALSVEVRSGWRTLGEDAEPEEFRIVLCTGGPHVQIRGELDHHGEPYRAWLEYQDWGTPMQEYYGEDVDADALLAYAQCFHFGEC